jgi:hypothetical protein
MGKRERGRELEREREPYSIAYSWVDICNLTNKHIDCLVNFYELHNFFDFLKFN